MGHSMHVASKFKHVKTETSNSTSHIESSKDLILLNRKVMCPIKLRRIVDAFRSKINEKLKLIYSSLEYLELDFLKSDKQEYYCLGIGKYTYSENKSLQRFANSKNSSLCKSPSSSSTKNPYSPLCSEVSSLRPVSELPSYAPSLDDNIRALISPKGGYRFMRYNYWKTKIDNGEKLLPNELKYAKNIASHSTRILIETSKNLADVKGMIKKLKGSFERKNKQGLFQTKLKTEINDLILRERERAKTRLEQQV